MNINDARIEPSTLKDVIREGENRPRRIMTVVIILLVAVFVVVGAIGAFDGEDTLDSSAGGTDLELSFPSVMRSGNEVALELKIASDQPLPETVYISVNEDYLLLIEDLAYFPEPESQTVNAEGDIRFEFTTAPQTRQVLIKFTGRASDEWSLNTKGHITVDFEGSPAQTLEPTTWRIP